MSEQITLILCGIAGVVIHSLWKLDTLQKDALRANIPFHWYKDYFVRDRFAIIAAFLSVAIWFLVFGEAATRFQWLTVFPRVSFVTMGMTGSYAFQRWLGRARKWINKIIDEKTDIADGKKER